MRLPIHIQHIQLYLELYTQFGPSSEEAYDENITTTQQLSAQSAAQSSTRAAQLVTK